MKKIIFNIVFLLGIVATSISQPKLNLEVGATYVIEELREEYSYDDFEKVNEYSYVEKIYNRYHYKILSKESGWTTLEISLDYAMAANLHGRGYSTSYYSETDSLFNNKLKWIHPELFKYIIQINDNREVKFTKQLQWALNHIIEKSLEIKHSIPEYHHQQFAFNELINPLAIINAYHHQNKLLSFKNSVLGHEKGIISNIEYPILALHKKSNPNYNKTSGWINYADSHNEAINNEHFYAGYKNGNPIQLSLVPAGPKKIKALYKHRSFYTSSNGVYNIKTKTNTLELLYFSFSNTILNRLVFIPESDSLYYSYMIKN